jgi:hypothetical protein
LSAIGKRQRRGGSGSSSASLTVPSSRSRATRSASVPKDSTVSAACRDFGDLAAVVRACGGGELQVSGAGKPWSATAGGGGCFEALCIGPARVGVSEPCVIIAGRGLSRRHRRNRALLPGLRAHVCVPRAGPYICRYARSWASVVNLGLCTSRRLVNLHSTCVASYGTAGKGLKVRRAYIEGGTRALRKRGCDPGEPKRS